MAGALTTRDMERCMETIRYWLALIVAKLAVVALKVTRHNGTNFPGVVALKICPNFLARVPKPSRIVGVTGTNGKTTTSNLIRDTLEQMGVEVLNNGWGSNINTGIATCLLSGVTITNRERYDMGVLEIDERSARLVFPFVPLEEMVVTNLSRDSIMRNAHPEYIRDVLSEWLPTTTRLVLNADDTIASAVAPENPRSYFGICKLPGEATECHDLINDMQVCPKCYSKLAYEYVRYSNIGRSYCPNCDHRAPEYDCAATAIDFEAGTLTYQGPTGEQVFALLNPSIPNIYNQVAAIATLEGLGYGLPEIADAMAKTGITKTRLNTEEYGSRKLTMMLCKEKNACADSRVFDYIGKLPGEKEVVLVNNCIGDTHHWSENTCWLYDCDFEYLATDDVRRVVVYGDRGLDLKLRCLLAGIPEERISFVQDPADAPGQLELFEGDNVFVLYGTDSFDLGMATGERVRALLKAAAKPAADKEAN